MLETTNKTLETTIQSSNIQNEQNMNLLIADLRHESNQARASVTVLEKKVNGLMVNLKNEWLKWNLT